MKLIKKEKRTRSKKMNETNKKKGKHVKAKN